MRERSFKQVDVFSAHPMLGNPVAVVLEAEGLSDADMAAFARWTNLSETTFVLPPTRPQADYRLRIFTPSGELPFAGHPTLGSCHAWREAGRSPRTSARIVQECEIGLVTIRGQDGGLAFAAPELRRSGPLTEADRSQVMTSLGIPEDLIVDMQWVDNGPGWIGVQLTHADHVLGLTPDFRAMAGYKVGVIGLRDNSDTAAEVRAFAPSLGTGEDPVTGSLNAGLAQWLVGNGTLPSRYVAAQGTCLGRAGRICVEQVGETIWVGGDTVTTIDGVVCL